MLQAQDLSVEVGGRLVVESASFTVMARDKVGIVGRNGAGKTSLFKVLGGAIRPDAGEIVINGDTTEIHSPQDSQSAGIGRREARVRPQRCFSHGPTTSNHVSSSSLGSFREYVRATNGLHAD